MSYSFQFSDFIVDPQRFELRQGTRVHKMEKIPLELLIMLVERDGNLVTRDEIVERLWGKDVFLEEDRGINTAISKIRMALHDDPQNPKFIQTVVGKGYRFIARINRTHPVGARTGAESESAATVTNARQRPGSLAVLSFADMSAAGDQDYFCAGLAEELINALTQINGLRVASRTASSQFRSEDGDIRSIGRKLRVESLLEGSVRKSGNRLRVTVQLIDIESGFHRWSRRFDCELADIFTLQDEIAAEVVASLRGTVLNHNEEKALQRPQTVVGAYEYYLRGRQLLPRMTQADLEESARMFECAVQLDANYGPAWAGMAMSYATLYEWLGARASNLVKAEHASKRAEELAPEFAEAHVARGFTLSLSGRYAEAAAQFEKAILRNPNLFEAYYYFARSNFASGNVLLSAELFRKAADCRQEDVQSPSLLSQSLRMLGRVEEARIASTETIARAERSLLLNSSDARALALGSLALFDDGQTSRALEWSRRSLELYPDDMSTLIQAACLHSRSGDREQALALLERVFARGWGKRDWIEHDPDYDSLRDDPRFQQLVSRLR
jgi:Predicted integral membrane protein